MARFTDFFIKRPVLAVVLSLFIFLLGVQSIVNLPVRLFPKMSNNVIQVMTVYPGANATLMRGFVTDPLQRAISSVTGIDYVTASSSFSVSTIQAHLRLNVDPVQATTDIMTKIAAVKNQLPAAAKDPSITRGTGSRTALMYISMSSDTYLPQQVTDYIERKIRPQLETLPGISDVSILGAKRYAMRIHLHAGRMAAMKINTADVLTALRQSSLQTAAGRLEDGDILISLSTNTALHKREAFRKVIVKVLGDRTVRIRDIGEVSLGVENEQTDVNFNGVKAVFIGIQVASGFNPLVAISHVRDQFGALQKQFPSGLKGEIVYDASDYIRGAINEVMKTLLEATLIVMLVIFLFVGHMRSTFIPMVTVPLSLVGVTVFLLALGYSFNLLTLLAMVLAIGLVVDDSIVVLENIHRHIESGVSPYQAALKGAREIASPVVAMTLTLVAVFTPIAFTAGVTGALFKEFAFTLAGAVVISGVVALTLSPMMCGAILAPHQGHQGKMKAWLVHALDRLTTGYQKALHHALNQKVAIVLLMVVMTCGCYFFYRYTPHELAPTEDQNVLFLVADGPEYASVRYMSRYTDALAGLFNQLPEKRGYFVVNGIGKPNSSMSGVLLKSSRMRKRSQQAIQAVLQPKIDRIPGVRIAMFPLPALPVGGGGLPLQFVLTTAGTYHDLDNAADRLLQKARRSGLFAFIKKNIAFDRPQMHLRFNRDRALLLGVRMADVGRLMGGLYADREIDKFSMQGRSYNIITELHDTLRMDTKQMQTIYVRSQTGKMVSLSDLFDVDLHVLPNQLTQFQQQNSVMLEGVMRAGTSLAQGLAFLKQTADQSFGSAMAYDYAGQSRQFIQEGTRLIWIFIFALIVIFLVLAAQFESFRAPLIILSAMPATICSALMPLHLGAATINIYTQVGLVTLVGIISKHGILMVDFANRLRAGSEEISVREAIEKASAIRLRPILMTSMALIVGVLPLLLSRGEGAQSHFSIGIVVATGTLLGTLCTLFIVPAMYIFLTPSKN